MARSQHAHPLFIRLSFLIFSSAFFVCSIHGQNHFLEAFNPQYQNILPLRTDSISIRQADGDMGKTNRFIRFKYGDDQVPEGDWVEIRSQNPNSVLWRIQRHAIIISGGKQIETETLDSILHQKHTIRQTYYGADTSRPDSILYEQKDSLDWVPTQKTFIQYNGGQTVMQTEARWNAASATWDRSFSHSFAYDQNKNLVQSVTGNWSADQWNQENIYEYKYKIGEYQPVGIRWTNNGLPVDSTVYWYDNQGKIDSFIIYVWGHDQWRPQKRSVFQNESQKQELSGNEYYPGSSSNWVAKEETVLTPGPGIYTNEPQEVITRKYFSDSDTWQDVKRKTTNYQTLPGGRIYGTYKIEELKGGTNWEETFFAEHWSTLHQFAPAPDSLTDRGNSVIISYKCGFSNPYVQYQTVLLPETTAEGNYEIKIFSEEGQAVFTQFYDTDITGTINADLPPGFYVVSIRKGAVQLCLQKLVVK